jgi:magnesium chelatase family protein
VRQEAVSAAQARQQEEQALHERQRADYRVWSDRALSVPAGNANACRARAVALVDSVATPGPVVWCVDLRQPDYSRLGADGWRFDADLPPSIALDWKDRIANACDVLAAGLPDSHLLVQSRVWALPHEQGLAAEHPSNQMAVFAGLLEGRFPLPPDVTYCGQFDGHGDFLPLRNPLAVGMAAKATGGWVIVPAASADLVRAVYGRVVGVKNPVELWQALGRWNPFPQTWHTADLPRQQEVSAAIDLCKIIGQEQAKRAVEIAVAGGHDLLVVGPPGEGKSLLASAIPGLAPPLSTDEALEVAELYHAQGLLPGDAVPSAAPLRQVDASISVAALLGGGSEEAFGGEVTLAHRGFLYFDEFLQCTRRTLEALRTPLQDGKVSISRTRWKKEFPAAFQLVAATNPCPCGGWTPGDDSRCTCTKSERRKYAGKLSQPLCDRLEVRVFVTPSGGNFYSAKGAETSAVVRARIVAARAMQAERYAGLEFSVNARVTAEWLALCEYGLDVARRLRELANGGGVSTRGLTNLVKVAQTVADLAGSERIRLEHLAEAEEYLGAPLAGAQ